MQSDVGNVAGGRLSAIDAVDYGNSTTLQMKRYLAPFTVLNEWLARQPLTDDGQFLLLFDDIIDLARHLITPIPVDTAWYFTAYPGLAGAIAHGEFPSAADHYIQHGYFEENRPFETERDNLHFPPPFREVKAQLPVFPTRCGLMLKITKATLLGIVSRFVAAIPLDEAWYCALYPGVAAGIADGSIISAQHHYEEYGYFEGRMPFPIEVDENWYLEAYPDVGQMISQGIVESANGHFLKCGYIEGRLPRQL